MHRHMIYVHNYVCNYIVGRIDPFLCEFTIGALQSPQQCQCTLETAPVSLSDQLEARTLLATHDHHHHIHNHTHRSRTFKHPSTHILSVYVCIVLDPCVAIVVDYAI